MAAVVMTNTFCLTLAVGCMSFCLIASAHWPPTNQELASTMSELGLWSPSQTSRACGKNVAGHCTQLKPSKKLASTARAGTSQQLAADAQLKQTIETDAP